MALDFQQVREQIKQLGENAPWRAQHLLDLRRQALQMLQEGNLDLVKLYERVQFIVHRHDPNLRCALPVLQDGQPLDALDACHPVPTLPPAAAILAADGSQIAPDRHAEVNYCLINVGAIQMRLGLPDAPRVDIQSRLLYDEQLYTGTGLLTDARLALMRDLYERQRLAELAEGMLAELPPETSSPLVITFTDGPMELWGSRDGESDSEFKRSLGEYISTLSHLQSLQAITAGYVDKPASWLVVRLLETSLIEDKSLADIRRLFPLRGVMDIDLYRLLLQPGDRSGVFAFQFASAASYPGDLGLHFFYLNVGREGHPWLARVEVPAWVAHSSDRLDTLHAVLVDQCRIMGSRPYPYILHRAHEAAVVSLPEKEQVTQMIALELRRRQVEVGETSYKQAGKDLPGRSRRKEGAKVKR
jgi:hypothetical protein